MRKLAIIPARGGSKRFPRKNIALLNGKPLLHHAIQIAQKAKLFDRIIISSEDRQICALAKEIHHDVLKRDLRLARDDVRLVDVCYDILTQLEKQNDIYELFCLLLTTAPLRKVKHIIESFRLLTPEANGVMSVVPFQHVPFWAVIEKNGYIEQYFGKEYLKGRDKLPVLYRHDGTVLWIKTKQFLEYKEFYLANMIPYYINPEESIDIDSKRDLSFAEFLIGKGEI